MKRGLIMVVKAIANIISSRGFRNAVTAVVGFAMVVTIT